MCTVTDEKGRTRHEFTAAAPNQLWVGDITEHWTNTGKLYLLIPEIAPLMLGISLATPGMLPLGAGIGLLTAARPS